MINKLKWAIYRFLERKLDNFKYGNQTYSYRKWLYLKVFKMDKEICHFCLKKSRDYYCWECAEETC